MFKRSHDKAWQSACNHIWQFLFSLFILLIPFQTRLIIHDWGLSEGVWEYGRISLYLNAIVLVLASIFFALSHRKELKLSRSKFLYFIFAYSVIVTFLSYVPAISFNYLLLIYLAALFAYLIRFLPKFFVLRMFVLSGLVQAIFAIVQTIYQKIPANKWLGIAEHLPEVLGTSVVEYGLHRVLRAYGTLPHPNILGGFLFVTIFIGIYLWVDFYKKNLHSHNKKISKKQIAEFIYIVGSLVVMTAGLLASFSRSAVLALGLSLFSILLIQIFRRSWLNVSMIVKYILLFIAVSWLFHAWWPGAWQSRWMSNGRLERQSIEQRVDTMDQLGWDNYQTAFLGQGLGMNTLVAQYKQPSTPIHEKQPIHDVFILLLAEIGAVGVFLMFNVVRRIIKSANQVDVMSTSLILGLVVIGLFDHYLWTSWTGLLLASFALVNMYKHKK